MYSSLHRDVVNLFLVADNERQINPGRRPPDADANIISEAIFWAADNAEVRTCQVVPVRANAVIGAVTCGRIVAKVGAQEKIFYNNLIISISAYH